MMEIIEDFIKVPPRLLPKVAEIAGIAIIPYSVSLTYLIKKYMMVYRRETPVGIYKRSSTKYYVDFVNAAVASREDLDILAKLLAYNIFKNCEAYHNQEVTRIVAQGCGNIILAVEVAKYLGLPIIVVGDMAGRRDALFGYYRNGEGVIIVDDIAHSGGMIIKTLDRIHSFGMKCYGIYVLLKRANECDLVVDNFNSKHHTNTRIVPFRVLLDDDIPQVLATGHADGR